MAPSDSDTNYAHSALQRRVVARYPLGGPEGDLPDYLRRQGFSVRRLTQVGRTGDQVYGEATLRWGGALLGRQARIYWRASKEGALTEVGAFVLEAGPLAGLDDL